MRMECFRDRFGVDSSLFHSKNDGSAYLGARSSTSYEKLGGATHWSRAVYLKAEYCAEDIGGKGNLASCHVVDED